MIMLNTWRPNVLGWSLKIFKCAISVPYISRHLEILLFFLNTEKSFKIIVNKYQLPKTQ